MTRRKFNADLAAAANIVLDGISDIKRGDDDGQLDFAFSHPGLGHPLMIRLVNMDIDGYPRHPGFLAFTSSDQVPPCVLDLLQQSPDMTENKSISDTLQLLRRKLAGALEVDDGEDVAMTDYEDDLEVEDSDDTARAEDDYDDHDDDHDDDDDEEYGGTINEDGELEYGVDDDDALFGLEGDGPRPSQPLQPSEEGIPDRLATDLRMAQRAGFKIGFVSDSIFSLSIRAQSLGLSSESLAAWNVDPSEYLVLLFQVQGKYTSAETFTDYSTASNNALSAVRFRFGKCTEYKPSVASALQAMAEKKHHSPAGNDHEQKQDSKSGAPFRKHLISDSLDHWMQKDFAALLKLRSYSLSWDESIEQLGRLHKSSHTADAMNISVPDHRDSSSEEALVSAEAPLALNVDWYRAGTDKDLANGPSSQRSLPLIAMQFALRYFAKSTSYCMVCHQKFDSAFAAMRPYVCEAPLCLYQYMSLGFGQSLEHEIIMQPLVVDLLISFCYSALDSKRLREYPKGLRILVPALPPLWSTKTTTAPSHQGDVPLSTPMPVFVDFDNSALWFDPGTMGTFPTLRPDDVVALVETRDLKHKAKSKQLNTTIPPGHVLHCKVIDVLRFNTSRVNVTFHIFSETTTRGASQSPIPEAKPKQALDNPKDSTAPSFPDMFPADMYVYGRDLDDLDTHQQESELLRLLETLPRVRDMRRHLLQPGITDLSQCSGISASALAFLKWIVASNRSLILQINCPRSVCSLSNIQALNNEDEAVSGMGENFIQFKFAQGSPDKERQFQSAVETHTIKSSYPTLFAWHGSRLGNWHSIIREGLDFKQTLNGRAFGNGVYFSRDYLTSVGYSAGYNGAWQSGSLGEPWPQSELQISSSISLCEIVNQKQSFVSREPHYVVDKVDWIQCRYLLVKSNKVKDDNDIPQGVDGGNAGQLNSANFLFQDPASRVMGPRRLPIDIPKSATRHGRSSQGESEKTKSENGDSGSVDDDVKYDDLDRFLRRSAIDGEDEVNCTYILDPSKTDFRPGQLDIETLPKLPSPTWADDHGRKVLGRELRKMQKVQVSTPQHELGWYMDFERTENLFHWIIELHSFDEDLPIAKDMKTHKIPSIVLEIRYGRQFPISPPFVRIIKPRFLPFAQGGGGHVTAGGAMCMELLTDSGWSPASSIESVILQVRMAICNLEPTPARLSSHEANNSYGIAEAIDAYRRVAMRHGWRIPPDLDTTATGS